MTDTIAQLGAISLAAAWLFFLAHLVGVFFFDEEARAEIKEDLAEPRTPGDWS